MITPRQPRAPRRCRLDPAVPVQDRGATAELLPAQDDRVAYLGSSSISRAWRPAFSQAIRVDPDPPDGSSTVSLLLLNS
jgi:hypothetical protein